MGVWRSMSCMRRRRPSIKAVSWGKVGRGKAGRASDTNADKRGGPAFSCFKGAANQGRERGVRPPGLVITTLSRHVLRAIIGGMINMKPKPHVHDVFYINPSQGASEKENIKRTLFLCALAAPLRRAGRHARSTSRVTADARPGRLREAESGRAKQDSNARPGRLREAESGHAKQDSQSRTGQSSLVEVI